MTTFTLPELGENIETAEVTRLLVSEGDVVEADQSVMELDSEKASFPLPSPGAGKVAKIYVKAGDTIKVGQPLLDIDEKVGSQKSEVGGRNSEEGKPAEKKSRGESESEKEPSGGGQAKQAPPSEEKEPQSADQDKRAEDRRAQDKKVPETQERGPVPAGPATRRLARELGVNLQSVRGSGPQGRITRDDVKAYVQTRLTSKEQPIDAPALPDFSRWGPVRRQRQSVLARTVAGHLSLAWRMVPHVTQHELADVTDLEAARRQYLEKAKDSQPKITMTVLCVQAAVAALKVYPQFNSSLDPASGELILKDYYHIGIAVDTEHGLLVPVLHDADRKTLLALATELDELAQKARKRSLAPKDMEGGTFTISNLGGIGGTAFTPIVNYPEVAILGISRARPEQVSRDGKVSPRLMLPLSLSYDHRVINGADGARFITKVAQLLTGAFELLAES